MTEKEIFEWVGGVQHPGKEDKTLLELGMVQEVSVEGSSVTVVLAFPKRPDPLKNYLVGAVKAVVYRNAPGGTEVEVKTVVREPAKPAKQELGLDQISEVAHIIGVASGKGGVGKSTVAVNLAIALARQGFRVGLADADVYGPSIPLMTGTEGAVPEMVNVDGQDLMVPVEKFGVKWMSIGYFARPDQALIWRGPMACSALKQMILQVQWGPLDFLLIDLPPGTGDIHISLVNDIPLSGALIVTTPQPVALSDVRKGIDLFQNPAVGRRILGVVENMSWFTPAAHPSEKYYIFGNGGGAGMAAEFDIPLLAQIPLVQDIRESGDAGEPSALGSRPDSLAFLALASAVVDAV